MTRDPRDVVTSNYFMGTPADGWDGSMRRFGAADETPNAFGAWPEHVRAFEQLAAPQTRAVVVEYEHNTRICAARSSSSRR